MNPKKQKTMVSEAVRNFKWFLFSLVVCLLFFTFFSTVASAQQATSLRFEVTIARGVVAAPQKGRLFIFLNHEAKPEPRLADDDVSLNAPPMLAKDVENFTPGSTKVVIDNAAIAYPIKNLAELPAGD